VEGPSAGLFAAKSRVASYYYGFGAAAGAKLGQNVADAVADAFFGEYEAAGNGSVVQPLRDQVQNFSFPWCQLRKWVCRGQPRCCEETEHSIGGSRSPT
jgi:hypothetical protein